VSPAGHNVPVLRLGARNTVFVPLTHLTGPPAANVETPSALDLPPVLPEHLTSFAVVEMLPVRPLHMIDSVAAEAGAADPTTPTPPMDAVAAMAAKLIRPKRVRNM
jgi:hypothetical protein